MDKPGPEMARALPETVERIMSAPAVGISSGATLGEAREMLERHGIHHLLVMHEGRVVGVLSDRDVLRSLSPWLGTASEQPRDVHHLLRRVYAFASFHPSTVRRSAPIEEAAALMIERGISCLPVTGDGDEVVGVVTVRDLLRGLLECRLPNVA